MEWWRCPPWFGTLIPATGIPVTLTTYYIERCWRKFFLTFGGVGMATVTVSGDTGVAGVVIALLLWAWVSTLCVAKRKKGGIMQVDNPAYRKPVGTNPPAHCRPNESKALRQTQKYRQTESEAAHPPVGLGLSNPVVGFCQQHLQNTQN